MDTFAAKLETSKAAHPDLEILYEKDSKNSIVSLIARVPFTNVNYVHRISFTRKSSSWLFDSKPIHIPTLTDTFIADTLNERFNLFQTATLHAIKFLVAFCNKTKWRMKVYTPSDSSIESVSIVIMKRNEKQFEPYVTIHLHRNDKFDDAKIHGRLLSGQFNIHRMSYELEFDTMQALEEEMRYQYEQPQTRAAYDIAPIHHILSVNMPFLSG